MTDRSISLLLAGAAAVLATLAAPAAQAQRSAEDMRYSDTGFQINPTRVVYSSLRRCARASSYLVPVVYLNVSARSSQHAGGGLHANARGRVFVDGIDHESLQRAAATMQRDIVDQLRADGFQVLTFADVQQDVADKSRMTANPRYGLPTRSTRMIPGIDFVTATPSDAQTLDFPMTGPQANYGAAARRTGATALVIDAYVTVPQLGASVGQSHGLSWASSTATITYNPSMMLENVMIYGVTPNGGWCSIQVQRHGNRTLVENAGQFHEVTNASNEYGDWATQRSDFVFSLDRPAFERGIGRLGRSLGRLVGESMAGRTYALTQ